METSFEKRFGITEAAAARKRSMRKFKDQAARVGITIGGTSVVFAICLIFFYLLYEVIPLFLPASIEHTHDLDQSDAEVAIYSVMEEQAEVGFSLLADGRAQFYVANTGAEIDSVQLISSANDLPVVFAKDTADSQLLGIKKNSNSILIFKHKYSSRYDEEAVRTIHPSFEYPFGEDAIEIFEEGEIESFAIRDSGTKLSIAVVDDKNQVYLKTFDKIESFLSDSVELEEQDTLRLPIPIGKVKKVLLSSDQRWLYLLEGSGQLEIIDLRSPNEGRISVPNLVRKDQAVTAFEFLLGGYSLLVGDTSGKVSQWFLVRDELNQNRFEKIRTFNFGDSPITVLETEHRRKGFVVGDKQGNVGFYNTTAELEAIHEKLADSAIEFISMTPRAEAVVVKAKGSKPRFYEVENEHPEVSWTSLWGEVWYENYEKPDYVWQSSSASNDFEPKFSLMPLTFGTLKAAFYAMLMAMPLAICGAIYTAYFMAPELRTKIKPTIELMEALPTVILGFLAGLWLAPLVEANLPGVFSLFIITPISILLVAYLWSRLPLVLRSRVPDGWIPAILIPVIILATVISMGSSSFLEQAFFGGDMRMWLTRSAGIDFDQRNSLVVGLAMGFAVIPTIFSITEDAIFAVPKALSFGSLALGATPWQTMVRVVLPTASPGIFSATMIGLGRAVGETMIVLMATGNTPIMDMNIFEGFRTLSANIAVEMPEAEVASSHFRILFLSGLVLFVFTFIVNTTAEIVRQRLREKYGSL